MTEDERTVDELFAELPEKWQRALEEVGLGLPELRRMAADDGDTRRVRTILADLTADSRPRRFGGKGPLRLLVGRPWLRLLLAALAGFVVCELSNLVLGEFSLLLGTLVGVGVIMAAQDAGNSRRELVLPWFTAVAYFVLIFVASRATQEWYLQLRGVEQTVTLAAPSRPLSHGIRETYCRVRLADGSVHQVFSNREKCADRMRTGDRATAVVDPSGFYGPFLGAKPDIDDTVETAVSLSAAAVMVLAPLGVMALGRLRRARAWATEGAVA
ncbi:hypothetical protein OHB14_30040 [Streptomyces sp. NBC_01613]|uniref:hypothetical protein n=1 Tax=Streptomyces sp. NBC_01613 TaxID=2975896 RepID=UPI0038653839